MPNIVGKTYGFFHRRGMGYGLWQTYGLWYAFPHPPSRWTDFAMGYYRLWVFKGMGYNRFNCTSVHKRVIHQQMIHFCQASKHGHIFVKYILFEAATYYLLSFKILEQLDVFWVQSKPGVLWISLKTFPTTEWYMSLLTIAQQQHN